jgi:hypothetical protein
MHRRDEIRIAAWTRSTATILGHPDVMVPCHIRNFSRSGICILVRHEIPVGHAVKVDWDGHFLVGRVQRVIAVDGRLEVGLQLLHCSQWQIAETRELATA